LPATYTSAAFFSGVIDGIAFPDAMLWFHAAPLITQVGVSKAHLTWRRLVVLVAPSNVVGKGWKSLCGTICANPASKAMH
jgi:hypothetical protein